MRIGVIADFNPEYETHLMTNRCFELASALLGIETRIEWLPTARVANEDLSCFNAVVVGTGIYSHRASVLTSLKLLRETGTPTLAMCGGFQHLIIE